MSSAPPRGESDVKPGAHDRLREAVGEAHSPEVARGAAAPGGGASRPAEPRGSEPAISTDPQLARVVAAWPALPLHLRAAVLAIVGALL